MTKILIRLILKLRQRKTEITTTKRKNTHFCSDCCEGRNYVGLLKNETSAKRENQTQTVNDVTFAQLGF